MKDQSNIMRSTTFLTGSTFISKLIGVFYLIPFFMIIGGEENLSLYGYAYVPYTIMITIANAGMPGAVSKYVAKYNALGAYKVSEKLYKSSLLIMLTSGFVFFVIMFAGAPFIAELTIAGKDNVGWSKEDVTEVIRVVSFAIILIPFFATWRGVFQGFESFGPTALSVVVEQLGRVLFLLTGAYIVMEMLGGSIKLANEVATFGATIGCLSGLVVLWMFWRKRYPHIKKQIDSDDTHIDVNYKRMYFDIIKTSIPFVVVSITYPLLMIIDQFTLSKGLSLADVPEMLHDKYFAMLNMTTHKIVMIPSSLAAGFAVALLPYVAKTFARGEHHEVSEQIKGMIGTVLFFTLPASVGIFILAGPLYTSFYHYDIDGITLLYNYAPVSILVSLFSLIAAILQSIDRQYLSMWIVFVMLGLKALLNIPMVTLFETKGAVYTTLLVFVIGIIIFLLFIKKYTEFRVRMLTRTIILNVFYTLCMAVSVMLVYMALAFTVFDISNRIHAVLTLIISVLVGMFVYGFTTLRSHFADLFIPKLSAKIRHKFKLGTSS